MKIPAHIFATRSTAVLNLTQHKATPAQRADGVVDLPDADLPYLQGLLTFSELPTAEDIILKADRLAQLAASRVPYGSGVMIGGASWLMAPLEKALLAHGLIPVYAFNVRDSLERISTEGNSREVGAYRHKGFVMPASFDGLA